jgi:NAD-dependent dihydropyrimidine dehydrogenase PreA subunit
MSHIIGNKCVSVCDTVCATVCPVDCIHGPINPTGMGEEVHEPGFDKQGKQLYIDPDTCIDCGACIPECPVEAVFANEDECIDAEGNDESVKKNYEFFGLKYE